MDDNTVDTTNINVTETPESGNANRTALMFLAIVIVVAIVVVAIFVLLTNTPETPRDPTEYELDNVIYKFSGNITEAWKFNVSYPEDVVMQLRYNNKIAIVFNGSSEEENAQLAKASFNIVTKLQHYYTYSQGHFGGFASIDLNDNATDSMLLPDDATYIYIMGPATGATQNLIHPGSGPAVHDMVTKYPWIFIEATDYASMAAAADKLVLLVLGYNESDTV